MGDLTSRTFLNQPSNYFTNTTSNIQEQINGLMTKNLGVGYWSIATEGNVAVGTYSGYNFAFGANNTNQLLFTLICADSNLVGIGIAHSLSVSSAITIGIFEALNTTSRYNITIPITASVGRQFSTDLTSQNITFSKGTYFRWRTTSGTGAGASRSTFFYQSKGVKGDIGNTWNTGFTGAIGTTGTAGYTGNTGCTGTTGYTGKTGCTGIMGYAGNTGCTGMMGYTGNAGTTGFTGNTGYKGFTGFTGFTGPQGEIGPAGPVGPPGQNGSDGKDGSNGDFSPPGPKGDRGNDGPIGAVVAVASVAACAAILTACSVALILCQGYFF